MKSIFRIEILALPNRLFWKPEIKRQTKKIWLPLNRWGPFDWFPKLEFERFNPREGIVLQLQWSFLPCRTFHFCAPWNPIQEVDGNFVRAEECCISVCKARRPTRQFPGQELHPGDQILSLKMKVASFLYYGACSSFGQGKNSFCFSSS